MPYLIKGACETNLEGTVLEIPEAKIEDLTLGAILSNPQLCEMARDLINEQVSNIFSI